MKARVKATGEVVDVVPQGYGKFYISINKHYDPDELDFDDVKDNKIIAQGEYILPEGCIAVSNGNMLSIRPSKKRIITGDRCRNCKHFGIGYTRQNNIMKTHVCFAQPKGKSNYYYGEPCYHHTKGNYEICDSFEKKGGIQ